MIKLERCLDKTKKYLDLDEHEKLLTVLAAWNHHLRFFKEKKNISSCKTEAIICP